MQPWLARVWDCPDLKGLRGRYLFDLAAICHCPPPVVRTLRLTEFANLIAGIDQAKKPPGG